MVMSNEEEDEIEDTVARRYLWPKTCMETVLLQQSAFAKANEHRVNDAGDASRPAMDFSHLVATVINLRLNVFIQTEADTFRKT